MYHAHFRGTHYEAGFRWGSLLLKHKNIILENIPFEITRERIDYALSCLPIYEKYYHEIVEEIQGLADGQQCDVRILQAVLFSMYSIFKIFMVAYLLNNCFFIKLTVWRAMTDTRFMKKTCIS